MEYVYEVSKVILTLGVIYWISSIISPWIKARSKPPGTINVPVVPGRLPFVGNGLAFSKDIVGYIRNCYKTYGPIFKLKIFNTEMIVVCDRALTDEYFSKKEKDMSLYRVLERLYFAHAFSDNPENLDTIIKTVKTTVKVDFDVFAPKIMEESVSMVEQMSREVKAGKKVDLANSIIKFIARTSSRCFVSFDISDEFFNDLVQFSHKLNRIVVLTYFLPKWLLKFWFGSSLKYYRMRMINAMDSTIQSYRDDLTKRDSLVIRRAVDSKLTNKEIGEILVCLLYVSSENTALGLTSALLDLSRSPKNFWSQVKEATSSSVISRDYRSLLADKLVDSCVMESARLNSHIFALNRQPMNGIQTLGNYWVGDVDSVALCEPMLMVYDAAHDKFSEPEVYNPNRFIDLDEPRDPKSVMTWGAGVHLCPGKMFAIYEIKMGLAMITNTFKQFKIGKSQKDYFSPSAFAEYTAEVSMDLIEHEPNVPLDPLDPANQAARQGINPLIKTFNVGQKRVIRYEADGHYGWFIPDYLNNKQQAELYTYTTRQLVDMTSDTEKAKWVNQNPVNPGPLVFDNLVYTNSSNCEKPEQWYQQASGIWNELREQIPEFAEYVGPKVFNSFYSQLYGEKSIMKSHKDQYVDYGVSVSIGSSAEFIFGPHQIKLHSGSVFIADFSKVSHEIKQVYPNTCPGWFDLEDTIGRNRLSVQIRTIDKANGPPSMSVDEFKSQINN